MNAIKNTLIPLLAGSLVTAVVMGMWGYLQIHALQTENSQLQKQVKKLAWREENLNKTQASLKAELEWLKEKKATEYDQTIGALMQAKDNAPIEALYELGVKALQEKDYPRAYYALAQVQAVNPTFKEQQKYYPQAKKAYESHQQKQLEDTLKMTYSQAYDQQLNGQFAQAKTNYQRVLALKANYKDAQRRLNMVSQYLAVREQNRDFEQKKQWLEASYKLGINAQLQGRFAQAKEAYTAIVTYAPRYKDAAQRLKVVQARLPKTASLSASQTVNCYEIGVAFGKCAKLGADVTNCGKTDVSRIPPACKDNPDFAKGLKMALSSGRSGGANGDNGGEGEPSASDLLKGLPSLLSNL
jgi:hypothetical protein